MNVIREREKSLAASFSPLHAAPLRALEIFYSGRSQGEDRMDSAWLTCPSASSCEQI